MPGPLCRAASRKFELKGEDRLFWHFIGNPTEKRSSSVGHSIVCMVDGHNGDASAKFLEQRLGVALEKRMPIGHVAKSFNTVEGRKLSKTIADAVVEALECLEREWAKQNQPSGCCVTIAIMSGWLLTIANIGDSLAYMQCNGKIYSMTESHRLSDNEKEKYRLEAEGLHVAGATYIQDRGEGIIEESRGILRVWPYGLALGRSFGDCEMGSAIVCRPHIKQVIIPPGAGARLLIASDGLWDCIDGVAAMERIQNLPVRIACEHLIRYVEHCGGFSSKGDDTTILVLDLISQQSSKDYIPSRSMPHQQVLQNMMKLFSWNQMQDAKSVPKLHYDFDSLFASKMDECAPVQPYKHLRRTIMAA